MKIRLLIATCFVVSCVVFGFKNTSDAATFNHAQSKHRGIKCSACHFVTVAQPNVRRFPGHAACASCHDFAQQAGANFKGFCGICHSGMPESAARPALFRFPLRTARSEFGIDFSHAVHTKAPAKFTGEERTMKCADCHIMNPSSSPAVTPVAATGQTPAVPTRAGAFRAAPEMIIGNAHANCFRCHGPKAETPPSMNQCAGCHVLGGPESPNLFGIVPKFVHEDHLYDIRPKKKSEFARGKVDLCTECHATVAASASLKEIRLPESEYCTQCHNGKYGLPEALPQDVLSRLASMRRRTQSLQIAHLRR